MIDNLPNGWKVEELGNLGKVFTGSSAPQEEKYFKNGKYPFIRVSDLSNKKFNRKLNIVNDYINDKCLNEKTQTFANKGTILFAKSGMSVRNNHRAILDIDGYIVSHLCAIYIEEKYTREYIYHLLCKIDMVNYSENEAYPSLKTSTIKLIKVPIPPLQQQEKIVKILNLTSDLIEKQKELLEKYDLFLKSKFIEMFGDPISNPMGWEVVKLDSLGKWQSGGTPSRTKPEFFKGNIDWYSAGELNHLYTIGSIEKITEEAIQKSSAKIFKENTLLIGMYDTAAFKMSILKKSSASNQAIANLDNDLKITNVLWLYFVFLAYKELYLNSRAGVRQQNLSLSKIKNFETILPPIELQNKFASIVEKIEIIKEKENQKLKQLEDLHNSMMNKAFKGEIE